MSIIHYLITKVPFFKVSSIYLKKPRKHHFINGRPGNKWFQSFLKRHPALSTRTSQILTISRENVSETHIRNWFSEIKDFLATGQLLHMIQIGHLTLTKVLFS